MQHKLMQEFMATQHELRAHILQLVAGSRALRVARRSCKLELFRVKHTGQLQFAGPQRSLETFYFELSNGSLSYYDSNEGASRQLLGCLPLATVSSCEPISDGTSFSLRFTDKRSASHSMVLVAASSVERDEWLDRIENVLAEKLHSQGQAAEATKAVAGRPSKWSRLLRASPPLWPHPLSAGRALQHWHSRADGRTMCSVAWDVAKQGFDQASGVWEELARLLLTAISAGEALDDVTSTLEKMHVKLSAQVEDRRKQLIKFLQAQAQAGPTGNPSRPVLKPPSLSAATTSAQLQMQLCVKLLSAIQKKSNILRDWKALRRTCTSHVCQGHAIGLLDDPPEGDEQQEGDGASTSSGSFRRTGERRDASPTQGVLKKLRAQTKRREETPLEMLADLMMQDHRTESAPEFASSDQGGQLVSSVHYGAPSISDFSILKPVSQGAFGKVMMVSHNSTGRVYAMKVLRKERGRSVVQRQARLVRREADVLSRLHSPFVIDLLYTVQTRTSLILVLNFEVGGDLQTLIEGVGFLSVQHSRQYCAEALLGIEHIHSQGIVHRDIKPANMLISATGHIRLGDLGSAAFVTREDDCASVGAEGSVSKMSSQLSSSDLFDAGLPDHEMVMMDVLGGVVELGETSPGSSAAENARASRRLKRRSHAQSNAASDASELDASHVGTPGYASPELLQRRPHSRTTDFWSLGVVLYEMLHGEMPFQGETPEQVLEAMLHDAPVFSPQLSDGQSGVRSFIEGLLTVDNTHRLGSGGHHELKSTPFFDEVEWHSVGFGDVPFLPNVEGETDTVYFDITRQPPESLEQIIEGIGTRDELATPASSTHSKSRMMRAFGKPELRDRVCGERRVGKSPDEGNIPGKRTKRRSREQQMIGFGLQAGPNDTEVHASTPQTCMSSRDPSSASDEDEAPGSCLRASCDRSSSRVLSSSGRLSSPGCLSSPGSNSCKWMRNLPPAFESPEAMRSSGDRRRDRDLQHLRFDGAGDDGSWMLSHFATRNLEQLYRNAMARVVEEI